jgi:hypothetical protein
MSTSKQNETPLSSMEDAPLVVDGDLLAAPSPTLRTATLKTTVQSNRIN